MDECGPCREQSRYIKAYIKQQQIITKVMHTLFSSHIFCLSQTRADQYLQPEMVQESVEHLDVSVTDVD